MKKMILFATLCCIFAASLFGCVPHHGGENPGNTNVAAFDEADSSDFSAQYSADERKYVTITESGQFDEDGLIDQYGSDHVSFPDETSHTGLLKEHGTEEEIEISGEKPERLEWEDFVNQTISCGTVDVIIEKIDHSVYREGYLIGDFFYEKPYLSGNSIAAARINDYFCRDYDRFLNGSHKFPENDSYRRTEKFLEEALECYDAKTIAIHPFTDNVVTKLTFLSEDYISFLQTSRGWSTGPRDTWNFGVTFSMTTGELVPFTEFVDIGANEFRTNLYNAIMPLLGDYFPEDIYRIYGPNTDDTFSITYYGTEMALDKSYFYDGHSLFLTLNYGLYPHDGFVIRWDSIMHVPCTINYDGTVCS